VPESQARSSAITFPDPYTEAIAYAFTMPRRGDSHEPNAFGFVGESPVFWAMMEQLAEAAAMSTHVLVLGEISSGKELAARAIHELSQRARGPFAHNAAMMPKELAESELVGNVKDYPNPGQPDRPGLIGLADCGTLFLDEIGDVPHELQTKLLRALDEGWIKRLGESKPRRVDFTMIAATNRAPELLKHDFRNRFRVSVELPSIDSRREDVPLLVRHLVAREAAHGSLIARDWSARTIPMKVMEAVLLRKRYPGNVRDLEATLWRGLRNPDDILDVEGEPSEQPIRPDAIPVDQIREALSREGTITAAARVLGISRKQLARLLEKHGLREKG